MEQHIKNIVNEAFKAHAASNNKNSKKRKNLQGDQAPHPSSPAKEKGKNTPQPKKKQKVAHQTTTDNNNNGTESILKTPKKKVRFQSNTKKGKDLPEGKKKGQRKGNKKKKQD